jgi:hypothetical protein
MHSEGCQGTGKSGGSSEPIGTGLHSATPSLSAKRLAQSALVSKASLVGKATSLLRSVGLSWQQTAGNDAGALHRATPGPGIGTSPAVFRYAGLRCGCHMRCFITPALKNASDGMRCGRSRFGATRFGRLPDVWGVSLHSLYTWLARSYSVSCGGPRQGRSCMFSDLGSFSIQSEPNAEQWPSLTEIGICTKGIPEANRNACGYQVWRISARRRRFPALLGMRRLTTPHA